MADSLGLPARFQIDAEIGRGGMAVVYRAHDTHLGRFVAIKVLAPESSHAVGAERFQREIALMAKLVHPGIVALFDSGIAEGRLYYVMPLVAGETLRARLTRERRLLPQDAAALCADIAEALACAHGLGIVHRDVKPENVFNVGGRAVLADFGIARMVEDRPVAASDQATGELTTTGMVVGTLSYMSPEQASGEALIDGRADLYSLGCVLYELITGAPPFVASTPMAIIGKHLTEAPTPASARGVALSAELDAIIRRLLSKAPADRPATAAEVARTLRALSQSASPTSTRPSPPVHADDDVVVGAFGAPAGDPECVELALAVRRAVAAALSSLPGVRVSFEPAGDEGAAGRSATTRSNTHIEGTLRRSGQRVRTVVQVLGPDGALRWSHHVDGSLDDPFALEDGVAASVREYFSGQSAAGVSAKRGATLSEADHLVTQGLRAYNMFGATGGAAGKTYLEEARIYLTRALALDPSNARGLCALGNWTYVAGLHGVIPKDEARGRELIFSALAADDQCAEVHCSLGKLALYDDDDFHAAERHIRRANELDPSEPEALRLLSIVYKILGRADEAVNAARAATDRAPDVAGLWNALGDALLAAGRNAEAVDALKRAILLLPGYGPALARLELAHRRLGELELALEIRSSRLRLAGQRERADQLDQEASTAGAAEAIRRDMRRELDGLLQQAQTVDPFADMRTNPADRIIAGHAELGEWREAMDWVERAYERRPGRLQRLLSDLPVDYRGLAVDPRYARLMRVAGMEGRM